MANEQNVDKKEALERAIKQIEKQVAKNVDFLTIKKLWLLYLW